jgi:hypothetical protein
LADIVLDINKKRDFQRKLYFELLVAIQHTDEGTTLTRITGQGTKHEIDKYDTLGIGGLYVKHFLQAAWYPEFTMEKAAGLGYFAIKYIEDFKLHSAVGIDKYYPQIWFVPDNESDEVGEKIDYEVNAQTKPGVFERIKKDAFQRFKRQERSMKN